MELVRVGNFEERRGDEGRGEDKGGVERKGKDRLGQSEWVIEERMR